MKLLFIFYFCAIFVLVIDQAIKILVQFYALSSNPIFTTKFIDIVLVYNKGIAFSMGLFLGEWLRWIIFILLIVFTIMLIKNDDLFKKYYIYFGFIVGAGFSNLLDRFNYAGVVDYIFWHYGFKFAVFNLADAIINISLVCIMIMHIRNNLKF